MKIINAKKVEVPFESKTAIKQDIRLKKNNDKLLLKSLLTISVLNSLMILGLFLASFDKIKSLFQ